jgi:hypothetical protein
MDFEWDPAKADSNRRKHGIDFADAIGVFEDPYALTRPDPYPHEARLATLGRDALDRLVVVVWTWNEEMIRLISARPATRRERRFYAEGWDA